MPYIHIRASGAGGMYESNALYTVPTNKEFLLTEMRARLQNSSHKISLLDNKKREIYAFDESNSSNNIGTFKTNGWLFTAGEKIFGKSNVYGGYAEFMGIEMPAGTYDESQSYYRVPYIVCLKLTYTKNSTANTVYLGRQGRSSNITSYDEPVYVSSPIDSSGKNVFIFKTRISNLSNNYYWVIMESAELPTFDGTHTTSQVAGYCTALTNDASSGVSNYAGGSYSWNGITVIYDFNDKLANRYSASDYSSVIGQYQKTEDPLIYVKVGGTPTDSTYRLAFIQGRWRFVTGTQLNAWIASPTTAVTGAYYSSTEDIVSKYVKGTMTTTPPNVMVYPNI